MPEKKKSVRRKSPAPSTPAPLTTAPAPTKSARRVTKSSKSPTAGGDAAPARRASAKEKNDAPPSKDRLEIVMVAPEAHPFAKTGGLAEVTGALTDALAHLGHSV